ncbi:MAG: hypothetical protein Q9222_007160 [Ikaeria aurantiellina]
MIDTLLTDHETSLSAFQEKIRELTSQAVCGRSYISCERLKEWLKKPLSPLTRTTHLDCLVNAAYRGWDRPRHPASATEILDNDTYSPIVFSMLLLLGKGYLIDVCLRNNFLDKHLPLSLEEVRGKLRKAQAHGARIDDVDQFAAELNLQQWRFCPVKFNLHGGYDFLVDVILPISRKEKINEKGGTATLWQIDVHEEFVGNTLRKAVVDSQVEYTRPNRETDLRYQFALKTFEAGSMPLYKNEKEALHALRSHKGIVRCLADFSHVEPNHSQHPKRSTLPEFGEDGATRDTFNLVLEFGEFDLDEFFAQRLPPVLQSETEEFWKALFDVADALEGIHNLRVVNNGILAEFYGWHADIKPDNILSIQGKFKLADPGFARFKRKEVNCNPEEFLLGGTETYGAPERYRGRRDSLSKVSRAIDIWSLGCVFSIAATWVVLGYGGIQQFIKMREQAIRKINQISALQSRRKGSTTDPLNGDYFHDGRRVLEDITSWHKFLRSASRRTDTMTSKVLDLVDQKMLLGDASSRIEAKALCAELGDIVERSQIGPRVETPEAVMKALLEADDNADSSASIQAGSKLNLSLGPGLDRKARKSRLLELPMMKTAHRSGSIKSVLATSLTYPEPQQTTHEYNNSNHLARNDSVSHIERFPPSRPEHQPQSHLPRTPPAAETWMDQDPRRSGYSDGLSTVEIYGSQTRTPKTHTPQDVFQAREEIIKRNKGNFLQQERKDKWLSQYFGNRDLKFLVDNAESMKPHWAGAKFLLKVLAQKAAGQDDNGLDLSFTLGSTKLQNQKSNSDKWEKAMEKAEPMDGARTNMKKSLGDIFADFLSHIQHQKRYHPTKSPKNMTLVVLTDGLWTGMGTNQNAVNDIVVNFINQLRKLVGELIDRPFSIEDIIDTEPSGGDVNKMLLGSFVEEYDEEDEEDQLQELQTPLRQSQSPDQISFPAPTYKVPPEWKMWPDQV